ncbi:hypothetical protein LXL04_012655 [Taraxacum kok-saghyz]
MRSVTVTKSVGIVQLLASKRGRVYQTNGVDKTDLRISIVTSLPSSPASDLLHQRFSRPKFLQNFTNFSHSNGPGGGSHESGGDLSPRSSNVREQDRFLPIANISRIMKKGLPANGKIAKDAKETVQECVSEFISFITSEASDKCQREKRKTINGDDLLWAMATLGFEDYIEPLKSYLNRYREGDTKGSAKGHDGSSRKDAHNDAKFGIQNPYTQGLNYVNSQVDTVVFLIGLLAQGQHMMMPMQRTE